MSDQETEALARQLWRLYTEAVGYLDDCEMTWDDLAPYERTAWIMVAQFVEARERDVFKANLFSNYSARPDNWDEDRFKGLSLAKKSQLWHDRK